MKEESLIHEKQDSIKVTKTSKGYTWEIKRYYDFDTKDYKKVIEELKQIDTALEQEFEGEKCK